MKKKKKKLTLLYFNETKTCVAEICFPRSFSSEGARGEKVSRVSLLLYFVILYTTIFVNFHVNKQVQRMCFRRDRLKMCTVVCIFKQCPLTAGFFTLPLSRAVWTAGRTTNDQTNLLFFFLYNPSSFWILFWKKFCY